MIEPLLSGIILGIIPIIVSGLLLIRYLQFRRRNQLDV